MTAQPHTAPAPDEFVMDRAFVAALYDVDPGRAHAYVLDRLATTRMALRAMPASPAARFNVAVAEQCMAEYRRLAGGHVGGAS